MKRLKKLPHAAANGLLDRRLFLKTGGMSGLALFTAKATGQEREKWSLNPGTGMGEYGFPSQYESHIKRSFGSRPGTTGSGSSRTPIQHLDGMITPSRLHFERHHSGIPDINPDQHKLIIHGLVNRPLMFTLNALSRYPTVSKIQFLECSGNSGTQAILPKPRQGSVSDLHGLISCSEWGGVLLSTLLDETGLKKNAKWIIAGGSDSAMMSRSIPIDKALDDAMIALYQNGERIRPSNGYPMRLFLPGWEGNASVKWLTSLKVTSSPAMAKDETSKYSDTLDTGISELFTFPMSVKSLITSPSPGLDLHEKGVYQISGIAWSGAGKIKNVEISTDGGKTWAKSALDQHVLPKALTRFRSAWKWDGFPATIMSRATDESGAVQPIREAWKVGRAANSFYHYNAIQAWSINEAGESSNVYV